MRTWWTICALFAACLGNAADYTQLEPDETIVFYPAIAHRIPGENAWRVEVTGRVYELEPRTMFTATLRHALNLSDVQMSAEESNIFNRRARLFLVDHERGKKVFVRHGDGVFSAGKSGKDGHFSHKITLREPPSLQIPLQAQLSPGDRRIFSAQIHCLEETGLSVISDIDDTIRITEVRNRNATLRNTFLREFAPVPGMADFYQWLARSNQAQFHYLSASPWQIYEPLAEFVQTHGFPGGTFALKEFRWKNRTFLSLFAHPEKHKPGLIEPILKRFPKRRFILIGDSGERDPEIYGALARKYPKQIDYIYIRDVTGDTQGGERYAKAFAEVPPERWKIFRHPSELRHSSP